MSNALNGLTEKQQGGDNVETRIQRWREVFLLVC